MPENPYLSLVQNETEQGVRTSMLTAMDKQPDAEAKLQDLARRYGMPVEAVRLRQPQVEQRAAFESVDYARLVRETPATAAFVSDPHRAAVAHDDLENMGGFERVLRNSGRAAVSGLQGASAGVVGLVQAPFELAAPLIDPLVGTILPGNPLRATAEGLARYRQGIEAQAKADMPQTDNALEGGWYSGVSSLSTNLAGLPLLFAGPAGQRAYMAQMVAPTGGRAYGQARDQGVAPLPAAAFGASQAAIEYGTEQIGMPALLGLLKPGRFGTKAVEYLVKEQGGEQIATALQDLNEWAFLPENKDKTFGDYLTERPSAALQTAIATAVGGGGQVAVIKGMQLVASQIDAATGKAQRAEQGAARLEEVNKLAAASKVLKRSPETFATFIASAIEGGDLQTVFIDGKALLQSGVAQQVAAVSPSVAQQLQTAAQTGGTIAIPAAEYATAIAPTEYAQTLADHWITDADGFSRAEAQQYMQTQGQQLQQDMERVLSEQQGNDTFKASQEAVKTRIQADLDALGRFGAAKNEADATLFSSYYAVRAAQFGVTPEALFDQRRVRFAAQAVGGQQFEQQGSAPVTEISGEEIAPGVLDVKQLRDATRQWYDNNLRNKSVVNKSSGRTVLFASARKAFSSSADPQKLRLFAALQAVVENGLIESSQKPTDPGKEPSTKAYHWLTATVNLGGTPLRVGVTLREDQQGNLYYNHNPVQEKGKAPSSDTRSGPAHKAGTGESEGGAFAQSLPQTKEGVNLQVLGQGPRGSFDPGSLTITLRKGADLSTALHEGAHFFFENDIALASELVQQNTTFGADTQTEGERQIVADVSALLRWHGITGTVQEQLAQWHTMDFEARRTAHERTAESFEAYLFEGKAPSIELAPYFQKFRAWMLSVYKSVKAFLTQNPEAGKLDDTVRGVFDRMLATGEQIALAEQGRSMLPLFATPEAAGMTVAEFAAYQAQGTQATADAIEDLQARGLRDMRWMHNARGRKLVDLQKQAAARRAEVRIGVRREVMSQPVYRAWQFLTNRMGKGDKAAVQPERRKTARGLDPASDSLFVAIAKLGGLDREAVRRAWGNVEATERSPVPVFGKPLLRKAGGLSLDAMGELLAQHGYLSLDENGRFDSADLEAKFDAELRGDVQFSMAKEYQGEQRAGEGADLPALGAGRLDLGALAGMFGHSSARVRSAMPQRPARTLEDAKTVAKAFVGQPLENAGTKLVAVVSNTTLGKMTSGKAVDKSTSLHDHALAVANVDQLFRNAVLDHSHPDRDGEATIAAIHRYVAPMLGADGRVLAVKITVKETTGPKEPNPLYTVEALEIENPPSVLSRAHPDGTGMRPQAGLNPNVAQALQGVKDDVEHGGALVAALQDRGMTAADGIHPDLVADLFEFSSGDELVRTLAAAQAPDVLIEELTDQRMLERFGELATPEAIERAADAAIHNEARTRMVATEANALAKATGGRRILTRAAKEFAARLIARLKVRDIKPVQYANAQARAAKAAAAAMKAGDLPTAAAESRNQMIQAHVAKAAYDALEEAQGIRDFFRKVTQGTTKRIVERGRDPDVVQAARAVLAAYGVGQRLEKGALEYLDVLKANDPGMYEVLRPSVEAAQAAAKPLDQLTMEELRGLADEVRSMWHLAKRSRQMEVDGNLLDVEEVAGELKDRMLEIGVPDTIPGEKGAITKAESARQSLQFAGASLRRVEQWAEGMDGRFGGPFRRYVFQPVKAAADRYRADRAKYRAEFVALLEQVAPSMKQGVIAAPELGYTFGRGHNGVGMAELLHAVLHTGNESNKRKLLLGRKWAAERADGTLDTSRWDAFINRMHREGALTKAHYDFAQGVWDLLEKTKPLAQKTHRDVFGRYFDEVTANEFSTPFGTYKGGYVPAQADPRIVNDAALRTLAGQENENMVFAFPSTAKGFTKSRVEYNRPLMLDLRTLAQHLDKVLLFAHMEPAVRDVNKLLMRKGVSHDLSRIQPAAYTGMLVPWLYRAARQQVETPVVGDGGVLRVLSVVRQRAGMALMFGNISNTIQQITGFSAAAVKVKPGQLKRATAAYIASPRKTADAVAQASIFMRDRMENEVSAINDAMDQILLDPSLYEKAQAWTYKHAYFLQSALDNVMSPIIWTGAYNQALTEGMAESDAVKYADGVVRQTQGTTLPEDVSRFETGGPWWRLFTQFIGYFNMLANTNATALKNVAADVGLRKGAGKALGIVFFGLLAPAWIAEAVAVAFRGGPDDEDDDGYLDDWLSAAIGMGTLKTLLAGVPILGQFASAGINRFNDNPTDDRLSLSPAVSMLEGVVGAPYTVYKALAEDGSPARAVKDVATAVSIATGLPAYAVARPLSYLAGVQADKIEPTGPADAARGLVTGTASPESRQR